MKTTAALAAILALCVSQTGAFPQQAAAPGLVYLVTRASNAESRALLSARLIKLNAANLRWYEESSVVRAELPAESLECVRADPDVILALPEQDTASKQPAPPAGPPLSPPISPPMPAAPIGAFAPMPAAGLPMGGGSPVMMGAGLMDSLAGGMLTRLFQAIDQSCHHTTA